MLAKIKITLAVFLISISSCLFAQNTLAVLDFENNSLFNRDEYQPLSQGLAEIMITELNQIQSIQVVERQKIKSVLDEIKLSQSGLISEQSSIQAGKLLGAHQLVFGSYLASPDKKIRIDVRIVNVETGLTIKAEEVTGKPKQVLSLIKKLCRKMLKDLDIRLTKDESKGLDKGEKIAMEAVVHFSQGLNFEDQGELKKAGISYKAALDVEPKFSQARFRLNRVLEELRERQGRN